MREDSSSTSTASLLSLDDLVVDEQLHVVRFSLWAVVGEVVVLILHDSSRYIKRLVTVDAPRCYPEDMGTHDLECAVPARIEGGEFQVVVHFCLWLREWTKSAYASFDNVRSKYADCCII